MAADPQSAHITRGDRGAIAAFITYSVLASGNAIGARISNQELDPLWGAALRFSLAGLIMLAAMTLMRHRFPRSRVLAGAAVYGALSFGGAPALAYYALVEIQAGFAQIVLALVPLATMLLAAGQRMERLRVGAIAAALMALTGVFVMSGLSQEDAVPLLSALALLGAACCFAQGSLTLKRIPQLHPVVANSVGMATGAATLIALSFITGSDITLPRQADTLWAIGYMATAGTPVVFTLTVILLRRWPASRVNYGFVIIPLITIVLSAWILDEELTIGLAIGGGLVLAAVYFGALRPLRAGIDVVR